MLAGKRNNYCKNPLNSTFWLKNVCFVHYYSSFSSNYLAYRGKNWEFFNKSI